jgi:hypothetical protein
MARRNVVAAAEPRIPAEHSPLFLFAFSGRVGTVGLVKSLSTRIGTGLVAAILIGAFLFALSLAAAPRLHAWVHPDSQAPHHECAVTLFASGSLEHCAAPVMAMVPQPAQHFATIPTFTVVWVAAAFSSSAIFEHAPPALS